MFLLATLTLGCVESEGHYIVIMLQIVEFGFVISGLKCPVEIFTLLNP